MIHGMNNRIVCIGFPMILSAIPSVNPEMLHGSSAARRRQPVFTPQGACGSCPVSSSHAYMAGWGPPPNEQT